MTTTLSSATAAAKAAQADFTAPVAANNAAANSGKGGIASAKPANSGNANNSANSAKTSNTNAGNGKTTSTAQAGQKPAATASQPPERSSTAAAAQAAAVAATVAAPVAAPLFSNLLNLADAAKSDSGSDDSTKRDDTTGSGSAAASDVLPAMMTSMLSTTLPVQSAPTTGAASGGADAVSATSSLNASATRLNLAAAGVAVTPATQTADEAAAALAASAPAGSAQNAYTLANNATLAAAAARQADADNASAATARPAPAADADAPVLPLPRNIVSTPLPEAHVNGARGTLRGADTPAAAVTAPQAAGAGSADDNGTSLASAATSVNSIHISQGAAAATGQASATVKLAGAPEQWQQPLREALGDRLQLQLQRNSDQAVIRLEPPNMGSIEISIRHSAGALQVNLSASNSDVVRQLNSIGDSVRQDLSNRQFTDVAVTVSSSRAQAQGDQGQGGRNGQQRDQQDGRTPGRALSDDDSTATFAMTGEYSAQ